MIINRRKYPLSDGSTPQPPSRPNRSETASRIDKSHPISLVRYCINTYPKMKQKKGDPFYEPPLIYICISKIANAGLR